MGRDRATHQFGQAALGDVTNDAPASSARRASSPPLPHSPLVLTVPEAAARLACGRSKIFELLATGELRRAQALGRRTLVTVASIERLEARRFGAPSGTTPGVVEIRTTRPTPRSAAPAERTISGPDELRLSLRRQRSALLGS